MEPSVYVGIDVAKDALDISADGAVWKVLYTDDGLTELTERLRMLRPALVVMEATGGLETLVASGCYFNSAVDRALVVTLEPSVSSFAWIVPLPRYRRVLALSLFG